jgi:hypothetical protein
MNDITYYFGAGASCKSMPLVSNFEQRFDYFISRINEERMPDKEKFVELCLEFLKAISAHLSFDTFFKKLFHQQKHPLIKKYKTLLLIYFLFEHLIEVPVQIEEEYKNGMKESNPDPRYEALIAGLLKPIRNANEFYAKVNFISWNYDAQLVDAIRNFIFSDQPLHSFIADYHKKGEIYLNNQVSITHLNGLIDHPFLNSGTRLNKSQIQKIFRELIHELFSHAGQIHTFSESIAFSWENIQYDNGEVQMPAFIQSARDAIRRSNNIIITGYSFPLYNRPIDSFLLNHETLSGKNIYIQDPNATDIKEILQNDLGVKENLDETFVGGPITQIKTIFNCSSFFVPNTIFKKTLGRL